MSFALLRRVSAAHIACALFAGAACAGTAQAAPVTFAFSGAVTDDPFGVSRLGAPISASFIFDGGTTDVINSAGVASYLSTGAEFGFAATVDGTAYRVDGFVAIGVVDGAADQVLVTGTNADQSLSLELLLEDTTGMALAGDALLPLPLLSAFGFRQFRLFGDGIEFLGSVDAAPPAASVPEPSSLLLAGAALLGMAPRRRRPKVLAAAAALLVALPAMAIDGVTLIDQNKAFAGSVTPGDTPGFPITISRPGSYRLTSNLTVPDSNTTAVEIASDNVTLDLNGFAILGPADCSAIPCVGAGSGSGVETVPRGQVTPRFSITVRNGTIQGMGADGIRLFGQSNLVDNVSARGNAGSGISLLNDREEGASIVRHSMALRNAASGINLTVGLASFNTASGNRDGIVVFIGTASNNHIHRNRNHGLDMTSGSYHGNSFGGNHYGNRGGVNQGQNNCDGAPCPGVQF